MNGQGYVLLVQQYKMSDIARAQLTIAIKYYNEGDYETAARVFKSSGEIGNTDAQRSYANMLYDGQGVEKDLDQAFTWYKKAAESGNAKAMYQLAYMCLNNRGESYRTLGVSFMKSSAKLGCLDAIVYLSKNPSKKHPMTLRSDSCFFSERHVSLGY